MNRRERLADFLLLGDPWLVRPVKWYRRVERKISGI